MKELSLKEQKGLFGGKSYRCRLYCIYAGGKKRKCRRTFKSKISRYLHETFHKHNYMFD